jgi:peptide/nickel transport system substrate-binding protein
LTTVDTKELTMVAEAVVADWQKIGVQAELLVVPRTEIQKDILRTRDYDALLYGELIAADSDFFPFWHSSQAEGNGLNLALWKNSAADKLLEQARTVSLAEREKLYQQFQDILLKDLPALFIYSPTYPYAMTRNLKGVDGHFMYVPADRFTDVHEWYIETTLGWE